MYFSSALDIQACQVGGISNLAGLIVDKECYCLYNMERVDRGDHQVWVRSQQSTVLLIARRWVKQTEARHRVRGGRTWPNLPNEFSWLMMIRTPVP